MMMSSYLKRKELIRGKLPLVLDECASLQSFPQQRQPSSGSGVSAEFVENSGHAGTRVVPLLHTSANVPPPTPEEPIGVGSDVGGQEAALVLQAAANELYETTDDRTIEACLGMEPNYAQNPWFDGYNDKASDLPLHLAEATENLTLTANAERSRIQKQLLAASGTLENLRRTPQDPPSLKIGTSSNARQIGDMNRLRRCTQDMAMELSRRDSRLQGLANNPQEQVEAVNRYIQRRSGTTVESLQYAANQERWEEEHKQSNATPARQNLPTYTPDME